MGYFILEISQGIQSNLNLQCICHSVECTNAHDLQCVEVEFIPFFCVALFKSDIKMPAVQMKPKRKERQVPSF